MIGKIDRAYYAQSLLLLSLCREAASHFEEKKTLDVSDALEKQVKPLSTKYPTMCLPPA